eukprot:TRINITY_DN28512_c0_g1_i1.p1 TRINITY_DN28512_c0_g1~~TRINITY_DN28512_c0_g1_i1.p1  ORF type:complete len:384 (-),score=64.95 TRINITY_DN28512_c0_g1_i1:42-1160(-)
MSVLLDAFDDAGLLDHDTRAFLVEALANAEEPDWRDILEPFVSPVEPSLQALQEPGVLEKSQAALAKEIESQQKKDEVPWLATAFLQALPAGVVASSSLHGLARLSQVCRVAQKAAFEEKVWERQTLQTCKRWRLSHPTQADETSTWHKRCLTILRPRCDGIYVGECGYSRWLRVGHHSDMRKNAAALNLYGGRGGQTERVSYRRYVRFLPPDSNENRQGWAFVLQDPCPRHAAERVLISGVDPETHVNPEKSEGISEATIPDACDPDRLRKRICVARYTFLPEERHVKLRYMAQSEEFRLVFLLNHGGLRIFSDCLAWETYEMENTSDGGDIVPFDLGRLPDWQGGGLKDENKDHFPQMNFRPKLDLGHLC